MTDPAADVRRPLIRPSFRSAIQWMAKYDDTDWLYTDELRPSVTAALVADLFGADDARVIRALRRAIAKQKRQNSVQP